MNIKCNCGHVIESADYYAGRLATCSKCQEVVPIVPSYPFLSVLQSGFRVLGILLFIGTLFVFATSSGVDLAIGILASGLTSVLILFTSAELLQVVLDYVGRAR